MRDSDSLVVKRGGKRGGDPYACARSSISNTCLEEMWPVEAARRRARDRAPEREETLRDRVQSSALG